GPRAGGGAMTSPASEFLELFRDEAHERLDRVVETLLALESARADADALDSLMRDMHTIKGAAGMVGLDDIRALAHAFEDVLVGMAEGGFRNDLTDVLLRAADTLRRQADGAD